MRSRDKIRDELRDLFGEMRDLSDDERRAKFGEIRTKIEAVNADIEKELAKVLLPHQLERLKQIDLQTQGSIPRRVGAHQRRRGQGAQPDR